MIRYVTFAELISLHRQIIDAIGGSHGVRDKGSIESCLAQPQITFGGAELYPTILEKAAILAFLLVSNHPFIDGNKRAGYVAMRVFLEWNGYRLTGTQEAKETAILALAAGEMDKDAFFDWVQAHSEPLV